MLLKSIKIKNFRQFINENELEFSIDPKKNVSIVLGENGSGKTSLSQAFTWCLYGITDFKDASMLNKVIESDMMPGDDEEVQVDLTLVHAGHEFRITRIQTFNKAGNGKIKSLPSTLYVAQKVKGQQEFSNNPELEIKQILPQELAGYFFLNGEHIDQLNDELSRGKSKEFAKAVENLLGLKAFLEAIDHFKPSKGTSVIGQFNAEYDSQSNKKMLELQHEIQNLQEKKSKNEARLTELESEIELGDIECVRLEGIIRDNQKSAEYQIKVDELSKRVNDNKGLIVKNTGTLLKHFNNFGHQFLSRSLVKNALEFLDSEEILDKGIPEIHERTIEFLIERGECICGTKIKFGEEAHKHLIDTLEFIPPKSIGTLISNFVTECGGIVDSSEVFFDVFETQFAHIREIESEIEDDNSEIRDIQKLLEGMKEIGVTQSRLTIEQGEVEKLRDEEKQLLKEIGALEQKIKEKDSERRELALQDDKNAKVEIYKTYAHHIYETLTETYKNEETKVREMLEDAINKIFKDIYQGGMSIAVDERYRIRVTVDKVKGVSSEIETSTAQSTSVIFAFIAGIIKLAKDFSENDSIERELLAASEPYPLVMDAPLSNFDKRRIKAVCDTLPKVAEQVIIFIKDTDGDIAEEHMGSIIGKRYGLNKINEIETSIGAR